VNLKAWTEAPTEAPTYDTKGLRSVDITYIYEINSETKLDPSALRKDIIRAVYKLNNNLHKRGITFTTENIRSFQNTGKPLAKYNAKELSRFLRNDTFFRELSTNSENTQVTVEDYVIMRIICSSSFLSTVIIPFFFVLDYRIWRFLWLSWKA
jgi:hypothetical protein